MAPPPSPSSPGSPSPRTALADLLLTAPPHAPTLCEGWDVTDLAVHLVVRDGRPDAAAGHLLADRTPGRSRALAPLRALAAHGARVEADLRALPLVELAARFRAGPPRWSPTALPVVERAVNAVEFYIHGEDVRRGTPGHEPVAPAPALRDALWTALRRQAGVGLVHRSSPVGVVLVVPDGPRVVARRPRTPGGGSVVLTGQPEELLLHASGRTGAARVGVSGPEDARRQFAAALD